jgi:hypothetical protein
MNPQLLNAEDLGVELEVAVNLAIWEASPLYKHQKAVDRIRDSIKKLKRKKVFAIVSMPPVFMCGFPMAR